MTEANAIREIVREIGKSNEYRDRFVVPFSPFVAAKLMYRHFLAREAESDQVANHWGDVIVTQGWQAAVDGFVDSAEYKQKFGDDNVPG